jgi:hypothetical protein
MIIVKSHEFSSITQTASADIATFINKNNLKKEDILAITVACSGEATLTYGIFYYGDSETKEITKGFLGW